MANKTNDTNRVSNDNNDDVVITDYMWDRIDAMLANAGFSWYWLQGEAHDSCSDAVLTSDHD